MLPSFLLSLPLQLTTNRQTDRRGWVGAGGFKEEEDELPLRHASTLRQFPWLPHCFISFSGKMRPSDIPTGREEMQLGRAA